MRLRGNVRQRKGQAMTGLKKYLQKRVIENIKPTFKSSKFFEVQIIEENPVKSKTISQEKIENADCNFSICYVIKYEPLSKFVIK